MSKSVTIVTGGSAGLGRAILDEFATRSNKHVVNLSTTPNIPLRNVDWLECDVSKKEQIVACREHIQSSGGRVEAIVNNAGVNHLYKIEDTAELDWKHIIEVNALSILLMAQAFMKDLQGAGGTILNIISNASHTPMTHSNAYNASKAAAHIMTLQMARELTKSKGITVFGISPAKLQDTEMSQYIDSKVPALRGWSQEEAKEYQLKALLTGEEIPPSHIAELVVWLLAHKYRHFHLSGCVIPYGA